MNLASELKELGTTPRDLRKFGLLVGGVCTLLGLWFQYRGKPFAPWFLWPGASLVVVGLILPEALKFIYLPWMALGLALGFLVSSVVLAVLFFVVITPLSLMARAAGKDFLNRRLQSGAGSYWQERRGREGETSRFEKQF